jgi:transposase
MVALVVVTGVTAAARAHGYSRAAFYLVEAAFEKAGVPGLLDERRGRKGPVKLTSEILAFLQAESGRSGSALAAEVEARFGVRLHRRTVERARRGLAGEEISWWWATDTAHGPSGDDPLVDPH